MLISRGLTQRVHRQVSHLNRYSVKAQGRSASRVKPNDKARSSTARTLSYCHCGQRHIWESLIPAWENSEEGLGVSSPMKGTAHSSSIRKHHPSEDRSKRFYFKRVAGGSEAKLLQKAGVKLKTFSHLQLLTGAHLAHETREVREADPT